MSGHLMATSNPEAVAAEHEVPPLGARVQFIERPGMGRGGKTVFAADVMHADPKTGACVLWVLFGREDYREISHVYRRTDQNPWRCWDYMPDGYDELHDRLDRLEKIILGDYNPPESSIIDILADFEKRVFAAQKK